MKNRKDKIPLKGVTLSGFALGNHLQGLPVRGLNDLMLLSLSAAGREGADTHPQFTGICIGQHSVVLRQTEAPSHAAFTGLMARTKLPGPAKAGCSPSCVLRRKWISESSVILSFFPFLYKIF